MHSRLVSWIAFSLLAALPAAAQIDARLLRFPDVSESRITFVYAGDVWLAPKEGGTARRLSTPAGEELFPRFSPDGARIAFTGNYDGNLDIYVVPVTGGVPERITHHPMADLLLDWTPDGDLLFASSRESGRQAFNQLYRVAAGGGLPKKLPVPYGEFGTLAPDGKTLAYTPSSNDFSTWKRYRGGFAPDIWLFDLEDYGSRNLTDHPANDRQPMWHGSTLYFLSDRGEFRRANLWAYDTAAGTLSQVTRFRDHDIHFPAMGPGEIVFENAGELHLLDLDSGDVRPVPLEVVTDRATLKPRTVELAPYLESADISPSGKRAVVEARGEVLTLPAEHGVVRNLSTSSGVAERFPAWSPQGDRIAYWTDRPGEYELTVRPADGTGEEEVLTSEGPGFRYRLWWSPDGERIAWVDQAMNVKLHDLASGATTALDKGLFLLEGPLQSFRVTWSADSRWLAYHRATEGGVSAVFLYDTEAGELTQVTSAVYPASQPVFDPEGKYLYLLWGRSLAPSYSDLDNSWIYANTTQIAAVPLRRDVPSPLAPRNDEEEGDEDDGGDEAEEGGNGEDEEQKGKKGKKGGEGEEKEGEDEEAKPEPVEIDRDGFEARMVVLPPAAGNYDDLYAVTGKVLYRRLPRTGAADSPGPQPGTVVFYDLEEREEKTVVEGVNGLRLAAGGEKILVRRGDDLAILAVQPEQKIEETLALSRLEATIDPAAEWQQIFADAWRFTRDYFYDPNLHGVDWEGMRRRYGALLDGAVTRWDVNFLLGELIGELNASHSYRVGGDQEVPERRRVGLLGVDFALENGAYRIADIIDLPPWETEVRSPLRQPGVEASEGDFLLAVNGVPLDPAKDPWAAFEGLAETTVELTLNDRPDFEGARRVLVETLGSETRLRNLAWIEANRKRVEEATGGRVGYIYVPNTAVPGQSELVRQFQHQIRKEGLIIDERFNGGGQIPDRLVELLDRPITNWWALRDGRDVPWPPTAHHGPKAMLINGWSGSGGDLFPFYFRQAGLGPLIGRRTWGGVIGISGSPPLIDGGVVTVATVAAYGTDGRWVIEGHGVEPDIEVIDDPTAMARGGDPQLERAVEEVLEALEANPPEPPGRPAYEDRSGY